MSADRPGWSGSPAALLVTAYLRKRRATMRISSTYAEGYWYGVQHALDAAGLLPEGQRMGAALHAALGGPLAEPHTPESTAQYARLCQLAELALTPTEKEQQ